MENLTINGRYRILQQIGVGGFGLTYLAEDLQLPMRPKSVVKHLRPQITDAETLNLANRLFQQEAEILYRLGGHPNIPSLIAHFKENGEFFLVQEFIEGHTLDREFLGGKKYNQKDIIQFLGQTLEILSFVHTQKVIHRDIKPANLIRRNSDGNIFLIDFGAVKQVSNVPRTPNSNATFSTITIGSHGYMPMEQMAGNPNFSSDLYALGLVAIEALTGIKPLDLPKNATTNEFDWAHKTQLSPDLERFISKFVRLDFRQRYVSASEALAALNSIAANAGFFQSRPQVSSVATIQPIVSNQNFQPNVLPINNPSFIPPTIIVSTQNFPVNNPPRTFQNNRATQPKKSSGMAIFFSVVGIFVFIGFLFVAGKILNFRWSSLDLANENPRQNSRQTEVKSSNNSIISLYDEALKQALEAAEMEKKATTRFEWVEISNKYKRAFGLLMSIEKSSPDYEEAQMRIAEYKRKAAFAEQSVLELTENTMPESAPMPQSDTTNENDYYNSLITVPPEMQAKQYLVYNYNDQGTYKNKVYMSDKSDFRSKVFQDGYDGIQTKVVEIEVDGIKLRFIPPSDTPHITPGSYKAVQSVFNRAPTKYAIRFDPLYCSKDAEYSFQINEIIYNNPYTDILYLDATFVMKCGNSKLIGRVHYDAK